MPLLKLLFLKVLLILGLSLSAHARISISIEEDIYQYAKEILAEQSISNFSAEIFNHPKCQRDVVEFLIAQRALREGGFKHTFSFTLGNYDARNLKLLESGLLLMSFDTIWLTQAKLIDNDVYISEPIIEKGKYFAGIYTSNTNKARLRNKITKDLSNVSVVSSKAWLVDWLTLKALSPKQLHHEDDWITMAKLVSNGWVDVMLVSFNNTRPFFYEGAGYRIEAIEGVKVALQDSRHFVVSRHHPLGTEAFDALKLGLAKLKANNFIYQAYRQCGFINPLVDEWHTL
ncbi:hypothetical protein CWB99_16970 [Pseudoalteromonas rubra]|uniref:Solute-binding protein family 3/N-terminal domain-containing protein n=1 Tax=Pseudoalteromonas rubra TaxID=43658 RepID=A0A5S3WI78_9GAMM|nr:hypothetical protein [Pseudoalteromonas rubra]TMP26914.1 hypothetical protein CWB99_16970 [Pseudoalteromonas rubra]TMP29446.1 hypothetical protein CWC00_19150 [Pseudoalteromonas rubra]